VRRPAWAEISTSAVAHNVRSMKAVIGTATLCAVVKANGYGHGGSMVAKAMLDAGADSLGVAIVDEGIELRDSGVTVPILVQAEADSSAVLDALAYSLTVTVGSLRGARDVICSAEKLGGVHRVHVKVDTGMHRMGVDPIDVDEGRGSHRR